MKKYISVGHETAYFILENYNQLAYYGKKYLALVPHMGAWLAIDNRKGNGHFEYHREKLDAERWLGL